MISAANPHAQYESHRREIDAAIRGVLDRGEYILGREVLAFEKEFAAWVGVKHAVSVANGTDAVHLALRASGIGAGDEVITVSHSAVATVAAVEMAGATPVLVDIDPVHFTIDPERIEEAITPRTRAILPVHLYGCPAEMTAIVDISRRRGVKIVEDCAQAHGARVGGRRVGAIGDAAAFSFYPTKNLGAIGDGGMIVTDDDETAAKARLLRQYGWQARYVSSVIGWNSRLDELQAAILRVKLRYLDEDNERRRGIAAKYTAALDGSPVVSPAIRGEHVFHLYVVRDERRDELSAALAARGIGTGIHYPLPIHLQPAYRGRIRDTGLAETERAARQVLSLPIYPELSAADVSTVASALAELAR